MENPQNITIDPEKLETPAVEPAAPAPATPAVPVLPVTPGAAPAGDASQLALIQHKLRLESGVRGGLSWFYWIAGVTVLNSIIYLSGGTLNFVVGLGAAQFVDGFTTALVREVGPNIGGILRIIAFVINLGLAGIFLGAGLLAARNKRWPIIAGMVLYALDSIIFLVFKDWFPLAFHGLGLYGLFNGLNFMKRLDDLRRSSPELFVVAPGTAPKVPWHKTPRFRTLLGVGLILLGLLVAFGFFYLILRMMGG